MKKLIAALAPLIMGASVPVPQRIFVERSADSIGRIEVLLLYADGGFASITSRMRHRAPASGQLDTERGYWMHCGRWRAGPGATVTIRRKLAESLSYYPPPHPGAWETRSLIVSTTEREQRLTEGGRIYAATTIAPIHRSLVNFLPLACKEEWHDAPNAP